MAPGVALERGSVTQPVDPLEQLIGAWERWEHAAAQMPKYPTASTLSVEAAAKDAAITALGLNGNQIHQAVAEYRRRHIAGRPGGMTVSDAIQTFINEGAPRPAHTINDDTLKEAS